MMTVEFFTELWILVEEIKNMTGLQAIVISGQGRHFSAGAQLDQLIDMVDELSSGKEGNHSGELSEFLKKNIETFLFFEKVSIPVISAIRGVCLGSALEFALFSHFRFCGEDAVFGLPETTFNLLPGIGGISRVASLSGKSRALEMVLRGNIFPAEEALRINLVDKILPKKQVVRAAIDFAGSIMNGYQRGKEQLYVQKMNVRYGFEQ
jgi:enoyl-CoA hydratase/carnithine racemase